MTLVITHSTTFCFCSFLQKLLQHSFHFLLSLLPDPGHTPGPEVALARQPRPKRQPLTGPSHDQGHLPGSHHPVPDPRVQCKSSHILQNRRTPKHQPNELYQQLAQKNGSLKILLSVKF